MECRYIGEHWGVDLEIGILTIKYRCGYFSGRVNAVALSGKIILHDRKATILFPQLKKLYICKDKYGRKILVEEELKEKLPELPRLRRILFL